MDKQLEEIKHRLHELEKQANGISSFLELYENNIYIDLVKQHTMKIEKEIEIALSFLSLMDE